MKNIMYRILSLAAALALATQSMVMMAFAADTAYTLVSLNATDVTGNSTKAELFSYKPTALPTQIHNLTDFDIKNDYLELAPAAGFTIETVDATPDTQIVVTNTASSDRKEAFLIKGVTKVDLDKRKKTSCTAAFSSYSVTAPSSATIAVTDTTTATLQLSAAMNFSGAEATPVHVNPATHDKTLPVVIWTLEGAPTGVTISNTGLISVPAGLTVNTYTFTAKAAATGLSAVVGSLPITVTVGGTCNAKLSAIRLGLGNTKLELTAGASGELVYTLDYDYTGCTIPGHTHSVVPNVLVAIHPPVAGVSVDAPNKKIKVDGTAAAATITVTATDNGSPAVAPSTQSFNLTRTYSCGAVVQTLTWTAAPAAISVPVDGIVQTTYVPAITWNTTVPCNVPGHQGDPTHGKGITWNVAPAVAGVTMANGVLSVDGSKLPATPVKVAVTATVGGQSVTANNIALTKTYTCTKALNPAAGSIGAVTPGTVGNGTLYRESTRTLYAVTGVDSTLQLGLGANKPLYTGSCQYEANGQPCPNAHAHRVIWVTTPAVAGVTLDAATGILSVHRDALRTSEATIELSASINGAKTASAYLVIHKGAYTPSTGSETTDEERRNEAYDTLEDKISYAERKDVIRQNIADYPDVPTRILGELRGQDITLELTVGSGYTWIINGKNLQKMPSYQIYLPLGIHRVTDSDILRKAKEYDIKAFEIEHEGNLYGNYKLDIQVGSTYAGKNVYLYKYVEGATKLSYKGAARTDENGYVRFPFTSASTYIVTQRPLYGENANTQPGGGTGGTGGGTGTVTPPASSKPVAPPSSVSPSSSASSSTASSVPEAILSSSSSVSSKPVDVAPEEPEEPTKPKSKIPIIVPILLVVVTITVIAVILLAKGGRMNMGD